VGIFPFRDPTGYQYQRFFGGFGVGYQNNWVITVGNA
jgi:hypothetical protein